MIHFHSPDARKRPSCLHSLRTCFGASIENHFMLKKVTVVSNLHKMNIARRTVRQRMSERCPTAYMSTGGWNAADDTHVPFPPPLWPRKAL